jgi:hypothetical protein
VIPFNDVDLLCSAANGPAGYCVYAAGMRL